MACGKGGTVALTAAAIASDRSCDHAAFSSSWVSPASSSMPPRPSRTDCASALTTLGVHGRSRREKA